MHSFKKLNWSSGPARLSLHLMWIQWEQTDVWQMRTWSIEENQNGYQKVPLKCAVSHLYCFTGLLATNYFDSVVPCMVGVCSSKLQTLLHNVIHLINHPLFNSIHPRKLINKVDLGSCLVGYQTSTVSGYSGRTEDQKTEQLEELTWEQLLMYPRWLSVGLSEDFGNDLVYWAKHKKTNTTGKTWCGESKYMTGKKQMCFFASEAQGKRNCSLLYRRTQLLTTASRWFIQQASNRLVLLGKEKMETRSYCLYFICFQVCQNLSTVSSHFLKQIKSLNQKVFRVSQCLNIYFPLVEIDGSLALSISSADMSVCRLSSFLFNAKLLKKIHIHLSITIKRLVENPKPVMLFASKVVLRCKEFSLEQSHYLQW